MHSSPKKSSRGGGWWCKTEVVLCRFSKNMISFFSGTRRDQTQTTNTGHYVYYGIRDMRVYKVDDHHPITEGTMADVKRSEIFVYKRL